MDLFKGFFCTENAQNKEVITLINILNTSFQPLAIIDTYTNDAIQETINGTYTLSFTAVMDEDGKSEYLVDGNLAEVEGQLFNIVHHRRTRATDGSILIAVDCEHVSYNLLLYEWEAGFVNAGTPLQLLEMVLADTGFTIGTVQLSDIISVDLAENISARAILMVIAGQSGGELLFNGYEISLLTRRGQLRGVQFVLGKNILGIVKDVDTRSGAVVTAYEIDVLELNSLPEFEGLEYFELGDTVLIIDPELGIDEDQRIVGYTYSPRRRINSKVVISNEIPGIADAVVSLRKTTVVKDKIYNGTRIGPENGFEAIRSDNLARTVMNATEGIKIQKGDGSGSNWTDVVYLDTEGNAVFSGKITASTINGGVINGASITGGSITSDTDINVTANARIGENLYMGIIGSLGDRKIEFVDSGIYSAFISFANASKELMIRGSNDVRISSGLYMTLEAMQIDMNGDVNVNGSPIVTTPQLDPIFTELDNVNSLATVTRYSSAVNMSYDSGTKNLKLFNAFGTQIAIVNLA